MARKGRVHLLSTLALAVVAVAALVAGSPERAESQIATVVTIGNTPLPVRASQDGTWNVGITGTPSVQVANTSPIPVGGVIKAVPDVSNQPFNCSKSASGPVNLLTPSFTFPIPIANGAGCPLSEGNITSDAQRVAVTSLSVASLAPETHQTVAVVASRDCGGDPVGIALGSFEDVTLIAVAPQETVHLDFPHPIVVGPSADDWCLMGLPGSEGGNVRVTTVGYFL